MNNYVKKHMHIAGAKAAIHVDKRLNEKRGVVKHKNRFKELYF